MKNLKVDRFQEFLQKAQIFKNKSSSLSDIELAIDKVSRIVFSLRRYLNTESQLSQLEINLVDELENALRIYQNYVIGKINLTKEFPPKLIFFGNIENISHVWKNIIFNAIQAMYYTNKNLSLSIQQVETIPERLISFKSSLSMENLAIKIKEGNWVLVTITDSGEGIPQNLQKKIFTPFFTTKPLGEGIGLGLYTCKKIVHEHGGIMFFKSEAGNTEFVVALPLKITT